MIEDMLQLMQFEKMTREDFDRNIYKIKDELRKIYGRYKENYPHKIPSMRDIKEGLEGFGYCKEDCSDIIRYGFQTEILLQDENERFGRIFRGIKLNY